MQFVLVAVAVPWLLNLFIICKSEQPHSKKLIVGWVVLLVAILVPFWSYSSQDYGSVDALGDLLRQIVDRVAVATVHILRYVLPFAVYPLVVFWLKLLLNYRTDSEETAWWVHEMPARDLAQQRQQAQLITFAIKVPRRAAV